MRRLITGMSGLALLAGTAFIGPALLANAADGTGAYGAWALDSGDKTRGTITFAGTLFPNATFTSTGQNLGVATSATLSAQTPFGASYGSSKGKTYLTVGLAAGVQRAEVTITFDTPPIAGTYGLAMGDVDAENVILSAKDASGNPVSVQEWNGTDFNYAGESDLPKWDGATGTITGNGSDTQGASMWILPAQDVKSITLTQTRTIGFPAYQLWIAADILTAVPAPTPTATSTRIPAAPPGKVTICHRTSSTKNPYVEITVDDDAVLRRGHDTHTGGLYPKPGWGDIIPPFPGYAGMNWPAGAGILNNDCNIPGEDPVASALLPSPSGTPTTSPSASPSGTPSTSPSTSPSATPSASPSASASADCAVNETALVNGGFEEPVIPAKSYRQLLDSQVPGWTTSAPDQKIEIWSSGFGGVLAPQGGQFAEINATQDAELSQVVDTTPGQTLVWSLYHRARGTGSIGDTMSVNIGPEQGVPNSTITFTDELSQGWVRHTGTYVVPAGQIKTRFGFESGRTASGNRSIGNFLDNIVFTTPACLTPEDTAEPVNTPAPPSSSPSASPSGSPSPSPSDTSSSPSPSTPTTPSPSPTPIPTPTETVRPPNPTPIVVAPDEPTVIPTEDLVPKGGDVIGVVPPAGGSAEVTDGNVSFTPAPGKTGSQTLVLIVQERDGTTVAVPVKITVGKKARPCVAMPASLKFGTNTLEQTAGACQPVTVQVNCTPLARTIDFGDIAFCRVTSSGGRTVIAIADAGPLGVKVRITGEATTDRPAIDQSKVLFVKR